MNEYVLAASVIPAFLFFVGLEYYISRRMNRTGTYTYATSVSNINIGIAERLLNLLITAGFYQLYVAVHDRAALLNIPVNGYTYLLLLLMTDLVWYWYHRLGHEINLLWAAHVVHHQSEEFNLTVSARITTLQALIRNLFWCVLPFIGFHPYQVIVVLTIHGGYSFFTHTQLIGKLGWIEQVLITPSHHRVHHASNEKYLNKNYGDIFVFWDKLFGTFQKEEEAPVYGLTHPLRSHHFLWQHFHYFMELIVAAQHARGVRGKLRVFFGRPEDLDPDIRQQVEARLFRQRYPVAGKPVSRLLKGYIALQLCILLVILVFTSWNYASLSPFTVLFGVMLTLLMLVHCGALLEQQHWAYQLEKVRMVVLAAYFLLTGISQASVVTLLILLVLVVYSGPLQALYVRLLYPSAASGERSGIVTSAR